MLTIPLKIYTIIFNNLIYYYIKQSLIIKILYGTFLMELLAF